MTDIPVPISEDIDREIPDDDLIIVVENANEVGAREYGDVKADIRRGLAAMSDFPTGSGLVSLRLLGTVDVGISDSTVTGSGDDRITIDSLPEWAILEISYLDVGRGPSNSDITQTMTAWAERSQIESAAGQPIQLQGAGSASIVLSSVTQAGVDYLGVTRRSVTSYTTLSVDVYTPTARGEKGDTGAGVPAGGDVGQVLAKATAADNDTEWITPSAAGMTRSRQDTIDLLVGDAGGDIDFTRDGSGASSDLRGAIRAAAVDTAQLADDAVTGAKIADDAVDTSQIAAGAVETAQIADDAVTNAKIANDAVDTAQIADDAVDTAQIADDAVNNAKIADDAVETAQIANDAVTSDKVADDAVDTAQIADGAVETAQIADDAVTLPKLSATGSASSTTFLRGDNTWATPPAGSGGGSGTAVSAHTPVSGDTELAGIDIGGTDYEITDAAARASLAHDENILTDLTGKTTDLTPGPTSQWQDAASDASQGAIASFSTEPTVSTTIRDAAYTSPLSEEGSNRWISVIRPNSVPAGQLRLNFNTNGRVHVINLASLVPTTFTGVNNFTYYEIGYAIHAETSVKLEYSIGTDHIGVSTFTGFLDGEKVREALGDIDTDDIADDAVTIPKLAATGSASSTTFLRGDNTWATPPAGGETNRSRQDTIDLLVGDAGGDIDFTRDGSGASSDLRGTLRAMSVGTNELQTGAVTRNQIVNNAIDNSKMADQSVGTDELQTNAVTAVKLDDDAVTTAKINNAAVTTAKLADDAVTLPKLSATGSPSSTTFLRGDNTWATPPAGSGGGSSASSPVQPQQISISSLSGSGATVTIAEGNNLAIPVSSVSAGAVTKHATRDTLMIPQGVWTIAADIRIADSPNRTGPRLDIAGARVLSYTNPYLRDASSTVGEAFNRSITFAVTAAAGAEVSLRVRNEIITESTSSTLLTQDLKVNRVEPIRNIEIWPAGGGSSGSSEDVEGIPAGGTTGQGLVKSSDTDYDTEWHAVQRFYDLKPTAAQSYLGTSTYPIPSGEVFASGNLNATRDAAIAQRNITPLTGDRLRMYQLTGSTSNPGQIDLYFAEYTGFGWQTVTIAAYTPSEFQNILNGQSAEGTAIDDDTGSDILREWNPVDSYLEGQLVWHLDTETVWRANAAAAAGEVPGVSSVWERVIPEITPVSNVESGYVRAPGMQINRLGVTENIAFWPFEFWAPERDFQDLDLILAEHRIFQTLRDFTSRNDDAPFNTIAEQLDYHIRLNDIREISADHNRGDWDHRDTYMRGDVVWQRNHFFICRTDLLRSAVGPIGDYTNWDPIPAYRGAWSATEYYAPGDSASDSGHLYTCLTMISPTTTPPADDANWLRVDNDSAAEIVTKLSSLSGDARLPASAIRDLPSITGLTLGTRALNGARQLRAGDGSWLTIPEAAAAANGVMSSADKTKLDGIAAGADVSPPNQTLIAGVQNPNSVENATSIITISGSNSVAILSHASSTRPGQMSRSDKVKLDGIDENAEANQTISEIVDGIESQAGSDRLDYTRLRNRPNVNEWALDGDDWIVGEWALGRAYVAGQGVTFRGHIMTADSDHTSTADNSPIGPNSEWTSRVELHIEASPLGLPLGAFTSPHSADDVTTLSQSGWMYFRGDYAATNHYYTQNVVRHNNGTWVCIVAHTAAEAETPSDSATKWARIA